MFFNACYQNSNTINTNRQGINTLNTHLTYIYQYILTVKSNASTMFSFSSFRMNYIFAGFVR